MGIIVSAAYFKVCACGRHGKLIASNGRESLDIGSKTYARQALDEGVQKEIITGVEIGEALRQIDTSSLVECEGDLTRMDRGVVEMFTFNPNNPNSGDGVEVEFWPNPQQPQGEEPTPQYIM